MHPGTRLRALLERPEIVVMPGVYDALSARLAEANAFEAVLAGGNAATGTLLAQPDLGQLGMRDLADHYGRIADAVTVPVLVDADTGFGGVHNVVRTVRAFENAGVAGLFIEDQATPKRCGYIEGKRLIPTEEMLAKIAAALDARTNPEFVICARTDALGLLGLEAAIERAGRYRAAGADATFVQGADRPEELAAVCRAVDCPQLANVSQASKKANAPVDALEKAGAAAAMYSIATLLAAAHAVNRTLAALRLGEDLGRSAELMEIDRYNELVGLPTYQSDEDRYIRIGKR